MNNNNDDFLEYLFVTGQLDEFLGQNKDEEENDNKDQEEDIKLKKR